MCLNEQEKRYEMNGNSGAGSYGRLANFKAEVINEFVKIRLVKTVIELGMGDGNQLQLSECPYYNGF
jgi:protein O-GlcNAc transferase